MVRDVGGDNAQWVDENLTWWIFQVMATSAKTNDLLIDVVLFLSTNLFVVSCRIRDHRGLIDILLPCSLLESTLLPGATGSDRFRRFTFSSAAITIAGKNWFPSCIS